MLDFILIGSGQSRKFFTQSLGLVFIVYSKVKLSYSGEDDAVAPILDRWGIRALSMILHD